MKKYKVNLFDISSIEQLAKDIEAYRNDLPRKCKMLCERLNEIGLKVMQAHIDESPLGKHITLQSALTEEAMGCKAIITGIGKTVSPDGRDFNLLLAVEFGAGIHHNTTANPKARKLGFGVATFPGQRFALDDGWWYQGNDGKWYFTHGVKATMPMYNGLNAIIDNVRSVAKEVFENG